jgi:flagellar biosynthesis GTPase FlhF
MRKEQKKWFEALTRDREESADTLEKPSMRGVQNSVVEKYSDQAHFVYELLQNADDVKATRVWFKLKKDGLFFSHNGKISFSISDPGNEDIDSKNGMLGHVNSITSIANSNKHSSATIGKFGVGFKAVFQYTNTPHIYEPELRFKIERFIVPRELDEDFPERNPNETLFWFPFDHSQKNKEEAYDDILEKFQSLIYPTLFLSNLKEVHFESETYTGSYSKKENKTQQIENTEITKVFLKKKINKKTITEKLWLFSRKTDEESFAYSVGFFAGKANELIPVKHPAFCFFPTKENTNLNFMVHAPFLLTDSREGIKAGEKWNHELIANLAKLAADSLIYLRDLGAKEKTHLIDDNIFNIIPYRESLFSELDDKSKISFKPFFTSIKDIFQNSKLLPTINGRYVETENAYWYQDKPIINLFSNKQLSTIMENPDARWVFGSLSRNQTDGEKESLGYKTVYPKRDYISSIVEEYLDMERLLKQIDEDFIACQSISWLHKFYEYLNANPSRAKIVKQSAIFLDENGDPTVAFDEEGQAVLFFPEDGLEGYKTINSKLLSNKTSREFFKNFGIKKPDLRDEIYNRVLPKYENDGEIDTDKHFLKFFKYFLECPQTEIDSFVDLLKEKEFVSYSTKLDSKTFRGKANEIYWPNEELSSFFYHKSDTKFLAQDEYFDLIPVKNHSFLKDFLSRLGVKDLPKINVTPLSWEEAKERKLNCKGRDHCWGDVDIDGVKEFLTNVDFDNSIFLWNHLSEIKKSGSLDMLPDDWFSGKHFYFYRKQQIENFQSSIVTRLKTEKWLFNKNGNLVSPNEVSVEMLAPEYDVSSPEAKLIIQNLNIQDEAKVLANLSDEQRLLLEIGKLFANYSKEEIEKAKLHLDQNRQKQTIEDRKASEVENENNEIHAATKDVLKHLDKERSNQKESSNDFERPYEDQEIDEDEFIKSPVDYSKKLEREKKRSAAELARIEFEQDLINKCRSCKKYSYGWFKALLELECLNSFDQDSVGKEFSIFFAKVEKEKDTTRTIVLKHPNRYIPQAIEDLTDIPLVLDFGEQTKKVAIEVVNVKSFTLRVKLKSDTEIEGIDLSKVLEASIHVKNPAFLLAELQSQFNYLDYDDDFCLHSNLPPNIEFIFGPPGTGKTTYLAKNILLPLMQEARELKILVLTPTNKAADVLVTRLMEIEKNHKALEEWLIRFGTTNDERIETSKLLRPKTFDIRAFPRNVTVTTIARFPYDYFMPDKETRLHLAALKWDYIIIDEASMIPLVNIIFPIFKKTPEKFIIAGDPFQIEPITSVDDWKDENLYTMVGLDNPNSFLNPVTTPHDFEVTKLTTQYRSTPEIGELFSGFTYNSILGHHRSSSSKKDLKVSNLSIESINLLKFPVSKYEGIFRAKRLQARTSYQVYSSIFTFEFAKYLSSQIEKNSSCENEFKIGIIAPYRAQASLIDKLISSWTWSEKVNIQVGTIHGFQGDECDIIITVFNPPPKISKSPNMFLNKKNILNVSISRAKDYLFILMPDDDTEDIHNLEKVKLIEQLAKDSGSFNEIHTNELENLIFGQTNFIEENAFSTSHQLVNVYSKPEKKYEIRSEDGAIDVQIHEIS